MMNEENEKVGGLSCKKHVSINNTNGDDSLEWRTSTFSKYNNYSINVPFSLILLQSLSQGIANMGHKSFRSPSLKYAFPRLQFKKTSNLPV